MMGKPPKLSDAQAAHLRVRYEMHLLNAPKVLCREYRISRTTFRRYILEGHK